MLFRSFLRRPYTFHLQRNSSELLNVVEQEVGMTIGIVSGSTALVKEILLGGSVAILMFITEPVAAVSTAFPSGRASFEVKARDTQDAISNGASEIDMVIDRGAFLAGDLAKVYSEIVAIKEICGERAHLKVILETGELVTYDNVRKASFLAMAAGADFIKTSTGKVAPAATPPVVLVMLEAVRDFFTMTGRRIGVKPAGGIRTSKDAIKQLVLVNETAGPEWLTPELFRIGASALLNDLLMQRMKLKSGHYSGRNYVTLD